MPEGRQLARVAVSHETWKAFRGAALTQDISVAAYLGRLVEGEVGRRQKRTIAGVQLDDLPAEQALQALAEVRASIEELDGIAGRLARTAAFQGASWEDVASSLRLSEDAARKAYGPSRLNPSGGGRRGGDPGDGERRRRSRPRPGPRGRRRDP